MILEAAKSLVEDSDAKYAPKSHQRTEDEMEDLAGRFEKVLAKKHPQVFVSAIEPYYDTSKPVGEKWIPETLHIGLVEIDVDHEGRGHFKTWIESLSAMADLHKVKLALNPTDEYGSNKERLVNTYRAFGFKGPDKNGVMIRSPNTQVAEAAFFSKQDPINTRGRVVHRKLYGVAYHGSSIGDPEEWFDTLEVDDEAAAAWVTPEEKIAKDFGQGRNNQLVFVNKYNLKGMKTAELDIEAYNKLVARGLLDPEEDIREALAEYLEKKGYSAWLTTGSIMFGTYEDIAIFRGHEGEAEYDGTSFRKKDGSWTPYQYFYDQDEFAEAVNKANAEVA
jgi:hypothetical protein